MHDTITAHNSLSRTRPQVTVRLGSLPSPVLRAGLISVSGLLVRARQQGLPPLSWAKVLRVGGHHAAAIPTAIKGARCVRARCTMPLLVQPEPACTAICTAGLPAPCVCCLRRR